MKNEKLPSVIAFRTEHVARQTSTKPRRIVYIITTVLYWSLCISRYNFSLAAQKLLPKTVKFLPYSYCIDCLLICHYFY